MTVTCSCCAQTQTDSQYSVGVLKAFRDNRETGTLDLCADCLNVVAETLKQRNLRIQRGKS
jgi:hypothetical protein